MDWDKVRQHLASTTVEERSKVRQAVSERDVEEYLQNYEKTANRVIADSSAKNYVSSAEYTANQSALDALERRRQRALEYLSSNKNAYEDQDKLVAGITDSKNVLSGLAEANSSAKDFMSNYKTSRDYEEYIENLRNKDRLEHLNIKEARDKKYALEQELANLGRGMQSEIGEKGTAAIVSSALSRQNKGQNVYQSMASEETQARRRELEQEINALTQDINLASRIQNTKVQKQMATGAEDFGQYSGIGAQMRDDLIAQREDVYGSHDNFSKSYRNPYVNEQDVKWMTDEETQIYDYYLGKYGQERADQFLESIADEVNYRRAEAIYEGNKDNGAYQALLALASGVDQWAEGTKSAADMILGDGEYRPQSSLQYAAGMTREDLLEVGKLPEWITNVVGDASLGSMAFDLAQTSANMLPSIALGHLGGGIVGAASMGLSASGNAYSEMIRNGYDREQATSYAVLVGASETVLEHVLGGITAFGGKLSNKVVAKFLNKVDNALARVAINGVKTGVSEFTEEYLQEILDPVFRNMALNEDNDFELITEEAIYSGILGALSAGFIEGPNIIAGEVQHQRADKALAEQYSELAGQAIENGLKRPEGTDIRKLAEAAQKRTDKGKTLSGRAMQELVQTEDKAKITEAVENRLKALGESKDIAVVATAIQKKVTDEKLSAKETVALNHSKYGQRILNELDPLNIISESTTSEWTKDIGTTDIRKDFYSRPKEAETTEEAKAETAKPVDAVQKAYSKAGIRIGSVGVSSKDTVREVLSNVENIDMDTAEKLAGMYEAESGVSANEFIRKTAQAFNIGYLNTPVESARAVLANSSVSSSAMMNAYYLGSNAFAKKHGEQAANSQTTTIKGVKGKVIFENGVDRTKLKPQQRVAVETMEKVLADATNIEFHIFESYVKDGKRYYKDENGNEIEGAPNGKYVGNKHEIWIDINAGGKGEGTMLYTLFHEMTHNIHTWSPEHFKNLTKIVAEAFDKGGYSFETAVQKKLAQYSKYEDYTRDNCIEEVIAEAMSGIGYDGKVIEGIASRVKAEDETLWQKIVDWLKSIVERIKKAYAEYPPSAPEARILMEQKELFEKAQNVFAEAVVESGRAYRKASETVTEGAFKGLEKVTEGDSDIYQTKDGSIIAIAEKGNDRNVKYNIAEYENGGKDILVNWLKKNTDKKTQDQIMTSMNYAVDIVKALEKNIPVFKEWGEVGITYDDSGKPVMRCRVKNGDYEINFDFSTVCKKRKGLDAVLNNLIKSGKINLIDLSKSDIQFINDTLNKYDFEIACGLCFVDSKRYRVGEWASNAANMYNDIVQSLVKPEDMDKIMDFNFGGDKSKAVIEGDISTWDDSLLDFSTIDNILASKSNAEGMGYRKAFAKLIKNNPKYRKQLLSSDIISSAGSDRMRNEAGDLLAAVNAVGGTSKPKMSFSESIYDHSVILDTRVDKDTAFAMGGARTQSFSDFIATMFFDYCQMFAEAAGKGLPMQAYTKELSFAKLFGLTGARINLSVLHGVNISAEDRAWLDSMYKYDKDGKLVLNIGTSEKNLERFNRIKENAGLDANGNYVYEQQSIDFDEAVKLQTTNGYSRFLGTIVVGISEKHIWKLLDDIRVRMVIPYHKSGISPVIAKARNIDCYNDFTAHQNTRLGESWGEDAGKSMNSAKLSSDTKKKIKEIAWDFYSVLHAYEKDWDTKTNSWKAGTKHSSTITYEMASNGVDTFRNDPMRQTCADYLEWCEKNDMIPQFEQFVKHPNYYKVQEDFDVYDCISGEYVPQTPLEFKLPSTENGDAFDAQEVLKTELELQQETSDRLNEKMPEMTKEIIDAIGRKIPPEIKVGKTMMQERDANSGYDGYSMSKRAAEAYRNGEMPISKWTKTVILDAVEEIDPAKATMLKNVPLAVLREKILSNTSWHHTSAKFNKTDFYSIDEDIIDELTETEIEKWQAKTEAKKAESVVRKGDFKYIEWAGTKSRPKPIEHNLENVNIETKGSFYIVTDDAGNELVRKKIGSNGTFVEYEEDKLKREEQRKAIEKAIEEKKKTIKANSSAEAFALYTELSEKGYDASYSGNMYHRGRKPAPYYHDNPQDFFKKGEQRLVPNQHGGYTLQTWDGDKWSSESGIRYSERDSEYMDAVNKGNMKTAQKLVDEAVKEVPDIYSEYKTIKGKLTKVPLKVWHYSRTVAEEGAESFTVFKTPAYFSKNKDYASYMFKDGFTPSYEKGEKAKPFYFVSRKTFMMPNIYGRRAFKGEYYISRYPFFEGVLDKDETYIINNFVEDEKIIQTLKANGYDSLYDKEAGYDCYIVLDANHIFSADPVTYDDNGNVIPLSERFNKANEDIRYQEREEDLSERGILAKALESAAQGEIEAKNLKNYKRQLAEYDELAVQLHLMKVELDEARKAKDTAKVKELRDKITQTENRLAVFDKRLLKLEAAAPLKALVERERKNAVARADERLSKAIQKQKDKDAEKLDRAVERAKASRQKTIDKLRESGKAKGEEVRRVLRESQEYARADGFLAGQMSQGREDAAKMRRMGERLSEQKLKSEQKLLAQAERYRASIKNAAEGRHKTEMRGKIKRKIGQLNALLNGGKERHVPEAMRGAVAGALDIINMDDERYYTSRLNNLRDKLEKATSSAEQRRIAFEIQKIELQQGRFKDSIDKLKASWEEIKQTDEGLYDPLIAEKIDRVSLDIGETLLRDMSMTQLEEVYDLYSMVLKRVQEANKLFDEKRKGEISEQGERIMAEFGGMKKRNKVVSDTKTNIEKFSWNNLKPVYAFMRIGSKVLQERFDAVREGEDVWARDITEAIDFFNKAKEKYNFKKWDKKKTFEFESSAGNKFKLNIEQMMSIYAYSKRKDADKHLMMGGFVFDPRTEAKKGKKHIEDATAYNISAETIQEIASKLTEEQRGYADTMQTYLSEVMGAKGNEVSMKMYDVKLFREKNYFPLKSSKQYMFETDNPAGEIKLKNSGFSKDRIPGANNPIVLSEFTDVWAGHVNDMSMYHAFVLPIDDFTRVYNYKTSMFPNQKSVKGELENVHGVAASAYIKKLLEDINGGARIDSAAGPMNKLIGKFKKASVMASLSVVVQQPSSIMRAFAEINPKYLLGLPKMPFVKHNSTWREIKKYAPVAIIKEMGYFDTNMGLSTVDYIKGEKTPMEWIDDKLGFLPGYMDEMTWGAIWHMVKRETKAKHPTMKVSSDEFLNLCGERFTDIVVKTQVYDSVLSRSANMRSPDGLVKMATAFMAEPTTSINMLGEAVRAGKRKNPARTAAIATSVISSVMLNSALASLIYAMRDDAEDETFWEKYIKNFNKEMVDGLNPLTYIPLVKDAVSILQGWDVKRSDMDLIDKLHTKTMTLIDLIFTETDDMSEEEKKEYYRQLNWAIAETGGAVADLFGIPGKNIVREIKGGLNTYYMIERQANEDTKLVTTKTSIGHSLEASAIDILPDVLLKPLEEFGLLKDKDVQDKIYDAVMAGDTEYIDRLRKGFDSDKEFNKQLRWGLRDNDERIEEAVIARHEGRFTEYENLIKDIVADGFDRQNVITAIEAETFAMFPEEEEESGETIKGMYNAEDFLTAYNKKNTTAMNSIRADIIKTYVAKGKTEDEAESKFHSAIYAATREEYEKGSISANAAKTILEQHSGRTEQKADAAITLWDYQSKYPNDDVEIYWVYDYHDHIQDSGMELKDYVDYRNDAKLCKGEDKNGDGRTDSGSVKKQKLLIIDALPITNEQKDAIYLAEGWSKNTMWEAPWR